MREKYNRTAARRYKEAQRRFVRSGQVEEKAREAKEALEGSEQREMERAGAIDKRHMKAEDPQITRKPSGKLVNPSGRN